MSRGIFLSMLWTIVGLVQLYFQYSYAGCTASTITGAKIVAGSKSSYKTNDVLTYDCDTGYLQTAGATTATCTSSGSWTWSAPTGLSIVCNRTCSSPANSSLATELVPGSDAPFFSGDAATLRCANGYYQAGGNTSAVCGSTGAWNWGSAGALTCNAFCAVPQVGNAGVTSTNETSFTAGAEVTLSCSMGFLKVGGSTTATCGSDGTWTWASPGIMQCLRQCPAPLLNTGSVLTVGTAPYTEGDTATLNCSTSYIVGGGNTEGLCTSTGDWQWGADGQLRCNATCLPPTPGSYTTMLSAARSRYFEGDVVEFGCLSGYVYSNGGSSGSCSSSQQWQWSGASAPLACIIAPKYKGKTAATFKAATCSHYVSRPAPTSSTCLLSCLYDEYCEGYAFTNNACFTDRPLIESQTTSISCVQRSG